MKVLIIDDECDQASINTSLTQRTAINRALCQIVNNDNYAAMNYVGYTATPYANILNEAGEESLYPRNFITTLAVSKEYFGPQQIFGYAGDSVMFAGLIKDMSEMSKDQLCELGRNGKEYCCEHFDWQKCMNHLCELLSENHA